MASTMRHMAPREDPQDELIRANLRRFREEVGLSQPDAAARIGIALDYLAKIERGARKVPKASLLKRFAEAYGHTLDHFLQKSPPPSDPILIPVIVYKVTLSDDDAELLADKLSAAQRKMEALNRDLSETLAARKSKPK